MARTATKAPIAPNIDPSQTDTPRGLTRARPLVCPNCDVLSTELVGSRMNKAHAASQPAMSRGLTRVRPRV
jgi:hypothetical protein